MNWRELDEIRLAWSVRVCAGAAGAHRRRDNCTPPPSALAPTLPAKLLPGMGTVHLAITTTNPEAQKFFDQGLAQMHSFWAREAERSFLQAAALDPAAPMPQWGIAMVAAGDWRPRFQIDMLDAVFGKQVPPATSRARAAAQKAVELSAVPGKATDLEKLYIAAVAARRDPAAKDPEEAFVKGMRALLAAHPDEVEAQLDLALMIMRGFSLPDKKPNGAGQHGGGRDPARTAAESAGASRRAPLHHPRLRRLDVREGCLAELREVRAAGDQHSARAAHARAHLLADRTLGGRREERSPTPPRTSATG